MYIQSFLRSGGTFEQLTERHIKTRRHNDYPNLVLFKYDIFADFSDPIVRECRGIILDESDNWRVVSRSFDKFFNYGEGHACEIDWATARVQEKLDGSLCTLYYYDGNWHVATTGTPDACGDINGNALTFQEYFWNTFLNQGGVHPGAEYTDFCFLFELMGPVNRIVVVHEKPWLRLLGVRNHVTGEEILPTFVQAIVNIAPVRSFPLTSIAAITASFETMSPLSQEGYVVVDAHSNRIKVKHPGYVALHHAKDGMTEKAFVEIVRKCESSEVLSAFPEFVPMMETAKARYSKLVQNISETYERIKDIAEQKAFAFEAVVHPWSAALFQMRRGVALNEYLQSIHIDRLMNYMGRAV